MKYYSKGFTLIELLIVMAIIGILSGTILANVNTARMNARDAKRITDLFSIQLALELYYEIHGTYQVNGSGYDGNGQGWVSYEDADAGYSPDHYVKAVTEQLYDEGLLAAPRVNDPLRTIGSGGYMIYYCDWVDGDAHSYALSATKENPTTDDLTYIETTCNGIGDNGTSNIYEKNYAIGNKTYPVAP